jgi:N6-L-threonylcarbamoyladenine synthase
VNAAKAFAFARQKPLVAVNHIEGHIYSNWLIPQNQEGDDAPAEPHFPALCLIVSGGHTELTLMTGHGRYQLLGKTVDDAAGEAFDKAARILGLGYPGGPAVQKAAEGGNPEAFHFPRGMMKGSYDFSFSGLKTALLRKVQEYGVTTTKPIPWQRQEAAAPTPPKQTDAPDSRPAPAERPFRPVPKTASISGTAAQISSFTAESAEDQEALVQPPPVRVPHPPAEARAAVETQIMRDRPLPVADLAASFQAAVVDALVEKTAAAAAEYRVREVLVAGGVAANSLLRSSLGEHITVPFRYPPLILCTDNAAMIAAAAYYRYADSLQHDFTLDIEPNARFV